MSEDGTDVAPGMVDQSLFRFSADRTYPGRYRADFYATVSADVSGRVLDVGAGGGGTHDRWDFELADDVVRIDIGEYDNLSARATGTKLPFQNESFDSVICSAVFEHVSYSDLIATLEEINRVLRPGGKLFAAVAFNYPLHAEPNDFHRPTVYGLGTVCEEQGLTVEKHYRGGTYIDTLLHCLFYPFRATLMYANMERLLVLFSLVHYIVKFASVILDRISNTLYGENPMGSRWYLMNGIVARKTNRDA